MRRRGWIFAAAAAAGLTSAAQAERLVDYDLDEASAAAMAVEQGVALAPLPARGALHVALEIAPAVDHDVLRVGIACSAWKVRNPMSTLVRRMIAAWDRDGAPLAAASPVADLSIRIDRAATLSRCVAAGELKTACITRVSIDGSVARKNAAAQPFHTEKEETTKGVGMCAGLTRGIGLVSRAAVSDMLIQIGRTSPAASPPG